MGNQSSNPKQYHCQEEEKKLPIQNHDRIIDFNRIC